MSRINLFLDSSSLFAGIVSSTGASRALLLLSEAGTIRITVSEQVIAETERTVVQKMSWSLTAVRTALRKSGLQIVPNPLPEEIQAHNRLIADPTDVPIVVAAMKANVDYLVTLNRRHFLDDPNVAAQSGLQIGTPGDALAWVRKRLTS